MSGNETDRVYGALRPDDGSEHVQGCYDLHHTPVYFFIQQVEAAQSYAAEYNLQFPEGLNDLDDVHLFELTEDLFTWAKRDAHEVSNMTLEEERVLTGRVREWISSGQLRIDVSRLEHLRRSQGVGQGEDPAPPPPPGTPPQPPPPRNPPPQASTSQHQTSAGLGNHGHSQASSGEASPLHSVEPYAGSNHDSDYQQDFDNDPDTFQGSTTPPDNAHGQLDDDHVSQKMAELNLRNSMPPAPQHDPSGGQHFHQQPHGRVPVTRPLRPRFGAPSDPHPSGGHRLSLLESRPQHFSPRTGQTEQSRSLVPTRAQSSAMSPSPDRRLGNAGRPAPARSSGAPLTWPETQRFTSPDTSGQRHGTPARSPPLLSSGGSGSSAPPRGLHFTDFGTPTRRPNTDRLSTTPGQSSAPPAPTSLYRQPQQQQQQHQYRARRDDRASPSRPSSANPDPVEVLKEAEEKLRALGLE